MSQQTDQVYEFNSYFLNSYSISLNRRLQRNERPFIKDYLITFSHLINALRFFVILIIEFNYETRLILFDPSIFIGGIAKYDLVISFLAAILGARLHELLYLTPLENPTTIKLIYMTRDQVLPQGLDRREKLVYEKLIKRSKLIFKILDFAIITFGKN
jgi:hypothetical protein